MPRIARVVIPNYPHHIIHRGNHREKVFLSDADKQVYIHYLNKYAKNAGIEFWAYCLMDNHVHFIAVPQNEDSFGRGFKEAHKHYTRMINFRNDWHGHLWEGRFKSHVLSEEHLYAAMRYVECNPVRAGIVKKAEDYQWSSAKAHVYKKKDILLSENFVIEQIPDWQDFLADNSNEVDENKYEKHASTGRPLVNANFIMKLEKMAGRSLFKGKPGPKKKGSIIK